MPTADRRPRLPSHTLPPCLICAELSLRLSKGRRPAHLGLPPGKHHTAQGPCASVSLLWPEARIIQAPCSCSSLAELSLLRGLGGLGEPQRPAHQECGLFITPNPPALGPPAAPSSGQPSEEEAGGCGS